MPVMNVSKFERFFRVAGGLDVDKTDLKRCSDFVHRKAYDLLRIELEPILEGRTQLPPLDLEYGETPFEACRCMVERRARAGLQNRRSASQKSAVAALGDHPQVVRSAAVKATSQSPKAID